MFGDNRNTGYDTFKRRRRVDNQRVALRQLATESHPKSCGSAGGQNIVSGIADAEFCGGEFPSRLIEWTRLFSTQCRKHRYRRADGENVIAATELDGKFTLSGPNQVWRGDVTYIRAGNHWIYLAAVMDLYARGIVGWELSN